MKQHTWCNQHHQWHTQRGYRLAHPQPKYKPDTVERLATDSEFREEFVRKMEEQGMK